MIRIALNITSLEIRDILIRHLNMLGNSTKITNFQISNCYDIYFMEIFNQADINKLGIIRKEDYQKIIILIGPANIELIKRGYDLEALGYLRINQFTADVEELMKHLDKTIEKRFKTYLIKNGTSFSKVRLNTIKYVESYKHYIHIHAISGEYIERKNICDFVNEMTEDNFIQIHKSYVVNLKAVEVIEVNSLRLNDGSILPVGKNFREQLIKIFSK